MQIWWKSDKKQQKCTQIFVFKKCTKSAIFISAQKNIYLGWGGQGVHSVQFWWKSELDPYTTPVPNVGGMLATFLKNQIFYFQQHCHAAKNFAAKNQ